MTPPATPKKQKAAAKPKANPKPRSKKSKGSDSDGSSGFPSNEFAPDVDEFAHAFNGIIKNENELDEM
jgi:hypothetical protein